MANPTYVYFSEAPSTIVLQGSAQFDGLALGSSVVPTITPGVYTFAPQAANVGKYGFHDVPVKVINIEYVGGGTLTATKHLKSGDTLIATLTLPLAQSIFLGAGEYLKFVTAGATNPKVIVNGQAIAIGRC